MTSLLPFDNPQEKSETVSEKNIGDNGMEKRIKLGISMCLLGENVRYDGQHKLDRYLRDTLGKYVDWVPVCPEVECGLPVPRESMHLELSADGPRLVTTRTHVDQTKRMRTWIAKRLPELEKEDLCGFVFKSKSPSSGMRDIKIFTEAGMPHSKGPGLFAGAFMERFPLIPVEDEGRLHDDGIRENFVERIFVFNRWKELIKNGATRGNLVNFHTDHKLLIMAHSPTLLRELGKLVAHVKERDQDELFSEYFTVFMDAMHLKTTVKKNTNVLHHMMGYFKKLLTADEKQELLEVIDAYHGELVPLIVPIVLFQHYVRKYDEPYLQRQHYLNPHPVELKLRNHV